MALLLCPPSLHSLFIRSLISKLSWSPSLVSKLSCSPSSPRRAVTKRFRRVSGKRPAIWCCCCLDLWEVIQLLTFPPYYGKHLKLVPTLRRFLAHLSLRVLVMLLPIPAALPRCSPDAPSTLLTSLSFYSAGHPPRSNLKSPASMFPLGHRYSWAIDPQLAAHCCVLLLSIVLPPGHTIRCMIDVLSSIDTDGGALPPARCDISTFWRYFQFACAHGSHYRPVPIDRLSRRPLPWLMVILKLSICPHSFWIICLFHFIFSAPSSLCRSLSLTPRTVAPAALNSVCPSFAVGFFFPWWVALLAFTSLRSTLVGYRECASCAVARTPWITIAKRDHAHTPWEYFQIGILHCSQNISSNSSHGYG